MKKYLLLSLALLLLGTASARIINRAQLQEKTNTGKVTLNDYNTLTGAVDVLTDLFSGSSGSASEIFFAKPVKVSEMCIDGECATTWPADPVSPWGDNAGDLSFVNGNVGIGIANPTEKLQVVGDITISGTLMQGGLPVIPTCNDGEEIIYSQDRLACGSLPSNCTTDIECDDSDPATDDTCVYPGTPFATCSNTTCSPLSCASLGATCGIQDDGCGGMVDCGPPTTYCDYAPFGESVEGDICNIPGEQTCSTQTYGACEMKSPAFLVCENDLDYFEADGTSEHSITVWSHGYEWELISEPGWLDFSAFIGGTGATTITITSDRYLGNTNPLIGNIELQQDVTGAQATIEVIMKPDN